MSALAAGALTAPPAPPRHLDHGGDLADLLLDPEVRAMRDRVEETVAAMDERMWLAPGPSGDFSHILTDTGLAAWLDLAETQHPIEQLGVLRGLCRRALPRLYLSTEDVIRLDRGMPVPLPEVR